MADTHYQLETRSWDTARALEQIVDASKLSSAPAQSLLLEYGRLALSPNDPRVANYPVGEARPDVFQDGPELFTKFDVLYYQDRQLSRRHQRYLLFGDTIPERVAIDLVVDASLGYVEALHTFIGIYGLKVLDRREVRSATFTGETPSHGGPQTIEQFRDFMQDLIAEQYPNLSSKIGVRTWKDSSGYIYAICNILAHGTIREVVDFRRTVLREGLPSRIEKHSITFEAHSPKQE